MTTTPLRGQAMEGAMLFEKDFDFAIELILFFLPEAQVELIDAKEVTYLPGVLIGHGDLIDVELVAEEAQEAA